MHLDETFTIDGPSGALLRRVVPRRGQPYEHACTKDVFQEVAMAIDCLEGEAFTIDSIVALIGGGLIARTPPITQVATAIAFLKERSCIVPGRKRKHVAASDDVHIDAMIEYHALSGT